MPIYDDVINGDRTGGSVLDAVTDPVDVSPLPDLTPDLYDQMFTQMTTGTADIAVDSATPENPRQADRVSDVGGKAGKIVRAAQSLVGLPYVWGGTSASQGVDCSGLVQLAYKAAGINLPRVSYQQANAGRRVSLDNLQPGDIVAFDNSSRNNGADHVGIYLGGGQIIEAARPGTDVRIRRLGNDEGAWGVRILGGN